MTSEICLGIDFGDVELRAAFIENGKVSALRLPPELAELPILFDPNANISSLGVGFPSLTQSIGSDKQFYFGKHNDTGDSVIKRGLDTIREQLLQYGKSISNTTMAVPLGMTQHRRKALLKLAAETGFSDATLIDRCTAAAIGQLGGFQTPGTLVTLHIDYSGSEFAIIRFARGRCRVIASGIVSSVSGEMLDALVMEGIILALRQQKIFLGLKNFTAPQWHLLRRLSNQAQIELSMGPATKIVLPEKLTGQKRNLEIQLDLASFSQRVGEFIAPVLDEIRSALEKNGLDRDHIDAFPLTGWLGSTQPTASLIGREFDGMAAVADPDMIGTGAALEAMYLDRGQGSDNQDPIVPPTSVQRTTSGNASLSHEAASDFVTLVAEEFANNESKGDNGPNASNQTEAAVDLSPIRALVEQGRSHEAAEQLNLVDQQLAELRKQLGGSPGPSSSTPRSHVLIQQAEAMLDSGRLAEAVAMSHRAYVAATTDAHVFTHMMRIHRDAGLAMTRPEQYEDSIQVLACAHGHDQTDIDIHKALAKRHYMHAVEMKKLNNPAKSLEATRKALSFYPDHEEAVRLLKELTSA